MSVDRGDLALVLHSHMPYVEGFGTWPFGEEWLWEAWSECYARLFPVIEGRPITLGVTPVLADQLEAMAGDPGDRMLHWLGATRDHFLKEDIAGFEKIGETRMVEALERMQVEYRAAAESFSALHGRDLIGALRRLADSGVELWTSSATHAILPLLATDFGYDLQIALGAASHERRFGEWGGGFWLPECAYEDGIGRELAARGVRWFCTDQTRHWGHGELDHLEPVLLPEGVVAVPIDWEMVDLVWSKGGFPSWGPYRDSFRRTFKNHMPWRNDGEPYDAAVARRQAEGHASLFVKRVVHRLDRYAKVRGRPGLLTCALDTELLGHWWYEGPWFLEAVFRYADEAGLRLSTVGDALARSEPAERALGPGSWGMDKDLTTWDSPPVAPYVWTTRAAELRLFDALDRPIGAVDESAALRATRELLALQSSDWTFKITHEKVGDYPVQRFEGHRENFERASSVVSQSTTEPNPHHPVDAELASLAPDLDFKTLQRFRCGP